MESLQGRVESFSKSKRLKNPSKQSTSVTVKWPHPKSFKATPDTLAEAGFYYNPSYDGRDNATCYMCGKDIEDWESDDDPFDIHWDKCGWTCGWAAARCALREDMDQFGRFVFHEKERVPTSKPMEKARLETYSVGDGWKHDRTKNHGSNSKKMAQAGFVYTPQYAGDDLATCLYCNVSLSGWEPEDDPMEEHKKREIRTGSTCPFLVFVAGGSGKPPSKQATKPPSRTASKSKHQDIILPTKIHDGDPDGDGASDSAASSVPPSVKSGKGRKGRSTSKARDSSAKGIRLGRSTSKKKESDEEVEEQEVEEAPKKRGRAQSKSAARSVSSKFSEKEVEEAPAPTRKRTTRSKSVARSVPQSEDEVEEVAPPTKKRAPSRARTKLAARSVPQSEDEVEAPRPTRKRAPSRAPSKSVARSVPQSEDEAEEAPPPTRKCATSRVPSKSIARSVPQSEDDMEGAPPPTKKRAGSKSAARSVPQSEDDAHTHGRKPSSSRAKSKALESEAEVEENLIPRKPSRSRSKATTSESESDMDVIPRKASRNAKPRPTVVIEEDESQEEPPKKKPLTKTRSKAKVIDSEIEIEHSNPVTVTNGKPPSKPSSRSKAKLAPVPVEDEPERSESAVEDEVTDIEPAPLRRKSSTSAPPRPIVPEEENEYHDVTMHDLQDIQQVPSTPPRPTASLHSDRDINLVPSSTVANVAISQPSSTGCSSSAAIPEEPAMVKEKLPIRAPPTPLQAEEDKEDRDVADVIMHEDQDTQLIPSTPPRPATPIRHDYAINPFSSSGPNTVLVQSSTANQSSATAEPMEQPVIPPLSKLPFTTLHALTDAEMDMTVEEWIRYQMDVEYDKFRRDGERELVRFRKKADEVRKIIEGL